MLCLSVIGKKLFNIDTLALVQHYSQFNKYILNPIKRDGYSGDGRRAMFTLKNEVLDKCLLRRTKATNASDMKLPNRVVKIREVNLHPIEEDFYNSLYTKSKTTFNDYAAQGNLLNNYAHVFDLLIRLVCDITTISFLLHF